METSENSKHHWMLSLVGTGIVFSLMTVAVMMGRYAQQVDEIAEDVDVIRTTALNNQQALNELTADSIAQQRINDMTDARIARIEGAK